MTMHIYRKWPKMAEMADIDVHENDGRVVEKFC